MDPDSLQKKLLDRIKDLIPPNLTLVDVLSDLLEISPDSVYRRIRNETCLSIEEVLKLSKHFHISLDELNNIDATSSVSFTYSPLSSVADYKNYLQSIFNDLEKVAATGMSEFIWVAKDFPIFYLFQSPLLGSFMIYYWFHCIINTEEHRSIKFSAGCIREDIMQLSQDIFKLYAKVSSVEIWTDLSISPLLAQIDYIWQSGLFDDPEDALRLCSLIEEQLGSIQKQADQTRKAEFLDHPDRNTGAGTFQLYYSDIEIGNNTILVKTGKSKIVYLIHNLNKIATINKEFCDSTEVWINNRIKKSTLISGVSERQRHQFFNGMRARLKRLEDKIRGEIS